MQRLTFDSMCCVLDLEPGCIGGGGGEDGESLDKDSANARARTKGN